MPLLFVPCAQPKNGGFAGTSPGIWGNVGIYTNQSIYFHSLTLLSNHCVEADMIWSEILWGFHQSQVGTSTSTFKKHVILKSFLDHPIVSFNPMNYPMKFHTFFHPISSAPRYDFMDLMMSFSKRSKRSFSTSLGSTWPRNAAKPWEMEGSHGLTINKSGFNGYDGM